MIRCPVCRHEEYEGTLYCSECGNQLWTGTPRADEADGSTTQRFGSQELTDELKAAPGPRDTAAPWTAAPTQIIVRVQGRAQPIHLQGRAEYRVGRRDPKAGNTPELDLAPFKGLELGVSREHALLKQSSRAVTLTDLGSTNGTALNGVRLKPNSPQALRDGDEVRLGKLTLRVFFESG